MLLLLITFIVLGTLAYISAPLWAWSLTSFILLVGMKWAHLLPHFLYLIFLGVVVLLILLNFSPFRLLFIKLFYHYFRNHLPHISRTEREALEAGETWWEAKLFRGQPNWTELLNMSKPTLTEEEQNFLKHEVEGFCAILEDWKITQFDLDLPKEGWDILKKKGFFGLIIPKEFGGRGFSASANSAIVQKIATRSLTAAVSTMLPNSLGPAELLLAYGTEEQKNYYLPNLATGAEIPCFALTGPEAGSDASSVPDVGIVCRGNFEGKESIGMRLTWDKRYITLAPIATVLGLAFKLYDPEGLIGDTPDIGMTLCLIPTNIPGIEIGKRHLPLNQPFLNGPTRGKDIFVPLDCIIGGVKMAGKGWHMIVESLSAGRGVSLPALSVAAIMMSFRTTGAYAKIRKQFHVSIGHFEGVKEVMAKIAGYAYILESTRLLTLIPIDQHKRPAVATAIAKYHMTELARQGVSYAMDVHGGKTVMMGPKNYLGRSYEGMPISITVEGANILSRSLIIFGQGAVLCHPYLRDEMAALNNKDEISGLKQFDLLFGQHVRYALSCLAKNLFHSLTLGQFMNAPEIAGLKPYIRQVGRMSITMSFVAEMALLVMGGRLKRRERMSARLGDMLSHLYLASAVIKYYHSEHVPGDTGEEIAGCKNPDLIAATWSLQYCLFHIQEAFLSFLYNLRCRPLAFILRMMVFPFGKPYSLPKDSLDHKLANVMMAPSKFRDRLSQCCYAGDPKKDNVAMLDEALKMMTTLEPLLEKVEKINRKKSYPPAMHLEDKIVQALEEEIINEAEAASLRIFAKIQSTIISVDEFSEEEWKITKGGQ